MTNLPEDIKPDWSNVFPAWFNVIRRLQSLASTRNRKYAILTIRVLVDEHGNPVTWSEPDCTRLEPMSNGEIPNVLSLLAGGIDDDRT